MTVHTLHIKNMVCNRCIKVVREDLEKLGLDVLDIKLGEAKVSDTNFDLPAIKSVLEKEGFELLEDKSIKIIERIKNLIVAEIHHDQGLKKKHENFSDYLAKEIGKDYHYLSSLFSGIENITIEKYIIQQKIERVKELLVYDELTLSEIAYNMEYSSVAHLSAQFKQVTGMSPSEFKKSKVQGRKPLDSI